MQALHNIAEQLASGRADSAADSYQHANTEVSDGPLTTTYFVCARLGTSAQRQLNSCPFCSEAIALKAITPMTGKIRKKRRAAMIRTGMPHLCRDSGTMQPFRL